MKSNEQRVIEKIRLLFFIVNELICAIIKQINKSEFVERFPELSVFFKACRALYDEMICIFPYFCPCEIIVREIREISF